MNEIVYSGLILFVSTLFLWFFFFELTNATPISTEYGAMALATKDGS